MNDWVYVTAALAGVVSMAALVHGLVTARSALARQQLKIVLAGMAAAVFVPALGLFAIILLGIAAPMNVLTPFFLLFPLSIAYAVGRHDLFRVDRYLRLGVAWAVLTVVVFASYAAVALAGQAWLGAGTRAPALLVPLLRPRDAAGREPGARGCRRSWTGCSTARATAIAPPSRRRAAHWPPCSTPTASRRRCWAR